jgi:NAD(P)-dependent dehydrogenase (short-subunit alcohol dehydrogenase family)
MSDRAAATARELEGRVALVTGGGRGIGRGIALALAAAGAAVAVGYRRDEQAARATAAEIADEGGRAAAFQASLDRAEEAVRLVDEAESDLGPIDILVSNAGMASRGLAVADTEPAELERVVATNALATHWLCRAALPGMRSRPRGDVIVISSSYVSAMPANGAPYNMAKAAAEALAMTLAKEEAANGIRVNVVAPGLVVTDMGDRLVNSALALEGAAALDRRQPLGRVCRPADIGATVRFLVSPASELITGQRICVDGGVADPLDP